MNVAHGLQLVAALLVVSALVDLVWPESPAGRARCRCPARLASARQEVERAAGIHEVDVRHVDGDVERGFEEGHVEARAVERRDEFRVDELLAEGVGGQVLAATSVVVSPS